MRKVALITGASRGIGRAIAIHLASLGYNVVINYHSSQESANQLAQDLEQKYNIKTLVLQADISSLDDLDKLLSATLKHWGRIDVLVNNAGITRDNLLIRMKAEEWQQVIDTNFFNIMQLTDKVADIMQSQDIKGTIVNISSIIGLHGNAGQANYATSKAGIIAYTKLKARQIMPNIQINAIAPGFVATDMTAKFDLGDWDKTPLGRVAMPEDIAQCVGWLVSSGSYITGQTIEIDGGLSMWSDVSTFTMAS